MSYLASESNHPDQPFAIFSGDCLFANSVGRPDLLGDEQTGGLVKQLYQSIYGFLEVGTRRHRICRFG